MCAENRVVGSSELSRTPGVRRELEAARALLRSGRGEREDVLDVVVDGLLRDLERTPEPRGKTAPARVVIRRHRKRGDILLQV